MSRLLRCFAVLAALSAAPAWGFRLDIVVPNQADFRSVSADLIAAVDYKALGPAEAGGLSGFGVGLVGSYVPVQDADAWKRLTGEDVDGAGLVGLRLNKGLPFDVDAGAFFSTIPTTDINVYGGELRYAIWPGSVAAPALAVRAHYVGVSGIRDFELNSFGADVSVSKKFIVATPYAGLGGVFGESDPRGTLGLRRESFEDFKLFAGVRLSFTLIEVTPEYSLIGDRSAFNLRAGIGF